MSGYMWPVRLTLLAAVWLTAVPAHAHGPGLAGPDPSASYTNRLIERAQRLGLHEAGQWQRLLHYRRSKYSAGVESENDGAAFFLSRRGKRDPRAELAATLRAFFSPLTKAQRRANAERGKGVPHPICRFPARFAWLSQQLGFDAARLPVTGCPGFVDFLREVDPGGVTLVFSSYYLNNPASAFGHTLLRFRKASAMVAGDRRDLLDYAVDFSADVDTGNALLYAIKGLFGMFPGTVKRMPFYYKVREYGDYETRDIWEYELNLTPRQVFMLLAHIWEVGRTFFRYFYIDENCSYRILMFLEAANPELDLVEHLGEAVLPADTVKAVMRNPGLVKAIHYRPSLRTQFKHAIAGMDDDDLDHVELLAEDAGHPLPATWSDRHRSQVLDAAADLFDVRNVKDLIKKRDGQAAEHKRELLRRRAALGLKSPPPDVPAPVEERPDGGHGSKRAGLGGGGREGLRGFGTLDFRLAMHDLADPSTGYPELAQLEFLPTRLRVWPSSNRIQLTLDDFAVVRIVSLTSIDRFDQSISWKVETGVRTFERMGCDRCLAGYGRGGGGLARAFMGRALVLFATLDLSLQAGPDLTGVADSPLRAGAGPFLGARLRLDPNLVVLLVGEWLWYPKQPDESQWGAEATLRWSFARDLAVSVEAAARPFGLDAELMLLSYF
ncbi:MAG: DUF4105 domain-containing protein [Myxococcales bacterium]|nr:DUF4105 domain-containing protein [Myxococcales bacterium]